jgi:ubiquitin-protein ligase
MDDTDVHKWNIILDGPEGSPYAVSLVLRPSQKHVWIDYTKGGKFKLLLVLPTDYPFKPPKLNFKTKIYHPNVTNDEHGSMCLGMLKGDVWKPSSKLTSVLTAAQQLLVEPVPDDAVQTDAADLYKNDRKEFDKKAKEWTKKHAN